MPEAKDYTEDLMTPELQEEFDFWERMSDETEARFNEQEDLGWHEA